MNAKLLIAFSLMLLMPARAFAADSHPDMGTPPRGDNANAVTRWDYPPESVYAGEDGVVTVRTLVREDGTVGEAFVARSSGFRRLDDAAVAIVKSRFRYEPATQGGKPVSALINQGVKWELFDPGTTRGAVLRIQVTTEGKVDAVEIVHSGGSPQIDDLAIHMVRRRLYVPLRDANGNPMTDWIVSAVAVPMHWVMTPPATGSSVERADYPPESIRLGEEGIVIVNVFVTPEGNVGDVQLLRSSGYPRLDEKALLMVRERFRYSPARDAAGKPIAAWLPTAIKWELRDATDEPAPAAPPAQ